MTAPTSSALVVPVPAAETVVGESRRVLDHTAAWGVPAHVTVLYPFLAPERLTSHVLTDVAAIVHRVAAFDCVFAEVRWFGEDAVWLAPEPAGPFRALTAALWRHFPDCPPYRGRHDDVVPHLTVGSAAAGTLDGMRRAAEQVRPRLPVHARVDQVSLLTGADAPGSWRTVAEFPLAR